MLYNKLTEDATWRTNRATLVFSHWLTHAMVASWHAAYDETRNAQGKER